MYTCRTCACTYTIHVHVLTPYMCVLMPYMCMYLSPGTLVQQSKHTYMYIYLLTLIHMFVNTVSNNVHAWCCVCVDARRQNVGRFLLR